MFILPCIYLINKWLSIFLTTNNSVRQNVGKTRDESEWEERRWHSKKEERGENCLVSQPWLGMNEPDLDTTLIRSLGHTVWPSERDSRSQGVSVFLHILQEEMALLISTQQIRGLRRPSPNLLVWLSPPLKHICAVTGKFWVFSPYQPNDVHFLFLLPLLGKCSGKRRYRRIVLRLSQSAVLMSSPSSFLRAVFRLICCWCTFPYNNYPNELHTPKHKCLQNHHRQTLFFWVVFFFFNSFWVVFRFQDGSGFLPPAHLAYHLTCC